MYDGKDTGHVQSFKWTMPGFVQSSLVDIFLIWNWSLQGYIEETDLTSPDEIAVEDEGEAQVSVINEVRLII